MHPLVHSPTQTTFKSKWNTFKTWITPELYKRRPSQCSTTSTSSSNSNCCCNHNEYYPQHQQKRPSITDPLDKCISLSLPFRRRSSNASSELSEVDVQKETEKVYELYSLAMDEINYAEDSRGSPYYNGDRIAAKEAIDAFCEGYLSLLQNNGNNKEHLKQTLGLKKKSLEAKFESLPLYDDLDSV